jgi:hypothetical protein
VEGRPLLIVNPQWRNEGQVVSDFGFGESLGLLCLLRTSCRRGLVGMIMQQGW